jgi:hypothetical protein
MVEDNPPFPHSVSYLASVVVNSDTSFEWEFTIFGARFVFVMMDVISYGTWRFMVESPEETKFLNTKPISAMGYTVPGNLKVLSASVFLNGFNLSKLPMFHYVWIVYYEWLYNWIMGDGNCHINDWITNTWRMRHLTRYCTKESEDLFSGIATESPHTEKLGRFSRTSREIQRWDERSQVFKARIAAANIAPNEEVIWLSPYPEEEIEPLFFYREEAPPCTWAETMTDGPG